MPCWMRAQRSRTDPARPPAVVTPPSSTGKHRTTRRNGDRGRPRCASERAVLVLKLRQPPHLRRQQPAMLLAPDAESRRAGARFPADLADQAFKSDAACQNALCSKRFWRHRRTTRSSRSTPAQRTTDPTPQWSFHPLHEASPVRLMQDRSESSAESGGCRWSEAAPAQGSRTCVECPWGPARHHRPPHRSPGPRQRTALCQR